MKTTDDKEMADVRAFHIKYEQLNATTPRHITRRKLAERANFLMEELVEFAKASGLRWNGDGSRSFEVGDEHSDQELEEQADALIDLVYVAKGTAVMLGLPWVPLWDDVQASNMRKELGATTRSRENPGQYLQDVGKPAGWVGPQTQTILHYYGYEVCDYLVNGDLVIDDKKCADDPQYKGE